jgi:outer membrane protein OmpA-like peptidoglycan-associated protein
MTSSPLRIGKRVILALPLAALAGTVIADRAGLIEAARAQQQTEEEKKKQPQKKGPSPKGAPPAAKKEPPTPPPPPPKSAPPPSKSAPPPPPKASFPPPEKKGLAPFEKKGPPPFEKKGPPPVEKSVPPPPKGGFNPQVPKGPGPTGLPKGDMPRTPDGKSDPPKRVGPPDKGPPPSSNGPPRFGAPSGPPPPSKQGSPAGIVVPKIETTPRAGPAPRRFDDVQKGRKERVEEGGRRRVIEEPGNRVIVKQDNARAIIRHDEAERFRRRPGAQTERRSDGATETSYVRKDGARVVTVLDTNGRLIRRYRRDRDGRERNIIDNRRFLRNVAIGVGIGAIAVGVALNLPPPRVSIPRDRYIVDYERASDDDLDEALEAEPVEQLERGYSLEEIRDNYELRARMRRIDLDTIHFDFGAWEVGPEQYPKLERIARAMLRVLRRRPESVFYIEGHTDLVGSEEDNLSLSDRRASAVAEILTEEFDVPPENLVTQGYGEHYPKIDTPGPEPRNRRVAMLNITLLMAER